MARYTFDSLSAGQVPKELENYMSAGDWSTFHIEVTKAKKDIFMKACLVECGVCWFFGCICVFCIHPVIENGMGKSKLKGCCNRMNKKAFQGREILHFSGAKDLSINTESLSSLPTLQPQNVATHSPMQQYQGQPQYVQGQPQYIQQGQPQYVQQGQPQYVQQGQPQYVQQGQQPQYVQQGQPQYVQQGQPQYLQQGHPPMVPAVVVAPATDNQQSSTAQIKEEDLPSVMPTHPTPTETYPPTPPTQRQGQYVVSDGSQVGTTVTIKTPEGGSVSVAVPADCPVGAIITYVY